jgi:hypothetical protein
MVLEWISVAMLLGFNIREIFGTGPFGDWRNVEKAGHKKAGKRARATKRADTMERYEYCCTVVV